MCGMSEWWRNAVVYQIYIRSFADSNGDGEGDIAGIRSRLPYLRDLGVDAIWITPWYPSPMADGGYDVADYRAIDPRYGDLDEARALIGDAHAAGLRLMIDIVPNHTSAAHPWFREALAADRGSPARARYFFRDGLGGAGEGPPNNWRSVFGGPAWTAVPSDGRLPRQWYLHLFDESQPDLDWEDSEVRADFERTLRFWLDLGVDGFRIDVASFLLKAPGLPDVPERSDAIARADDPTAWDPASHPYENQPGLHEIYRCWREIADAAGRAAGREVAFCGEIHLPAPGIASFLGPSELHTAFNFDFALRPWDADALRSSIDATLATHAAVGAPPTWVIGNHDLPRPTYRYGRLRIGGRPWNAWERTEPADAAVGLRRARAASLLYLALPGSAYLYQGDELGLPEVLALPSEARQDPTFRRSSGSDVGRDGTRIPIPWHGDRPPYGFGPDGSRPWLPQPAGWSELSVAAESADPTSILELYRAALRLRHSHPGLASPDVRWLPGPERTLVFGRAAGFVCAVNLSDEPLRLPAGATVLIASAPVALGALAQDSAAWLHVEPEPSQVPEGEW
jgi:alpha-glucosidase